MRQPFTVIVGAWRQLAEQAAAVRHDVFVQEQKVPLELELDEHDPIAIHAVAVDGVQAIGTGRLLPDAHIGRMAVLRSFRGRGAGALILATLIHEAQRRGDPWVLLAAQRQAQAFYRQYGFVAEGQPFMDAGIVHVMMRKVF